MPANQRRDLLPPPRPGWQDRAACARADPDLFDGLDRWQAAVGFCLDCPVRDDCLIAGLAKGDHGIIRGGTLLTWSIKRGHGITALICPACGHRPVRPGQGGNPGTICGPRCPGGVPAARAPSELMEHAG